MVQARARGNWGPAPHSGNLKPKLSSDPVRQAPKLFLDGSPLILISRCSYSSSHICPDHGALRDIESD